MDTKRRLRIVWTALCLLAAAFFVVSPQFWPAGIPDAALDRYSAAFAIACVASLLGAAAPWPASKLAGLVMLWLGAVALTFSRDVFEGRPPEQTVTVALVGAGIAVVLWIISPAIRSRSGA